MTRFLDGPAIGKTLMLKRAPFFLRVTVSESREKKTFDALDQLEDQPRPNEDLFVYEMVGKPGSCHVRCGNGGSGFYMVADYKMVEVQPEDIILRDTAKWAEWVDQEAKRRGLKR